MSQHLFYTLSTLVLMTLSTVGASLPVALPAGTLENIERLAGSEAELPWLSSTVVLRQAAAANSNALLEAGAKVADEAIEKRPPTAGKAFIVLEIAVASGRTISPFDYLLVADGDNAVALGMAQADTRIVDFRYLKADGPARVRLVFECPEQAMNGVLRNAFGLPLPDIALTLQTPPEPPAAAAVAAPVATAVAAPVEAAVAAPVEAAVATPVEAAATPAAGPQL